MPRTKWRYVCRQTTRHGRRLCYFRRGKGPRVRLPDDPGSPEFEKAYWAAANGETAVPEVRSTDARSIQWLIDRYRESAAWMQLATATKVHREQILQKVVEISGNAAYARFTRRSIERGLDRRAATPGTANNFLATMRGLFAWAVRNGYVDADPTAGVKRLRNRSEGYPPWAIDDAAAFRARHGIGTMARLAFELLLLTGLRCADIVTVGRQHLRGDVLTIRTHKTGATVTIRLPAWLMEMIEATPSGSMHFLANHYGRPFPVASFSPWFRAKAREAGVAKSAHGVRKLSATLAADGGAAAHELMAQFGWTTIGQAQAYTRNADRRRLGVRASEIVAGQIENKLALTPDSGEGKISKTSITSKE